MASALISTPTTALAQSLLSSNSSVHVPDSFDTATPFVDEVLEVSPVQASPNFDTVVDFVVPHSGPFISDVWLRATLPDLADDTKFYLPKAGFILLKKVKVFVGTQLVHEYEGAYDAIYDELEQDRSLPHNANLINECWAPQLLQRRSNHGAMSLTIPLRILNGFGRKNAVPLYKLRGTGNDLKIQITFARLNELNVTYASTANHTAGTSAGNLDSVKLMVRYTHVSAYELSLQPNSVTYPGKFMQSYEVGFKSGTAIRLPFTGVCYELLVVVRDATPTAAAKEFWKFRPLTKIGLKCDNIKVVDDSILDANFIRTVICSREHRNVPTRKFLELLQGFAASTDAEAQNLITAPAAGDVAYDAREAAALKALQTALLANPWSGNDTPVTTVETQDRTNSDIVPASTATGQFGVEYIYSLPFGTEVGDDTKMFGGLDFGAFKTVELTLTTAKTGAGNPPAAFEGHATIYCRYYNEISYVGGGAYRRFQ
eukprot:tig00021586_g22672.t1